MDTIKILVSGGLLTGIFAVVQLLLNRYWKKKDEKYGVMKVITAVEKKLDEHIAAEELANVKQARIRIIRFADDIRHGVDVSEEYVGNAMEDIDLYETYCEKNPGFPNSKAKLSIAIVKQAYLRPEGD